MLTSDSPQAEVTEEISRTTKDGDTQTGLRILRAGGDVCPQDDTRLLSFTLDVYCDSDQTRNPGPITSSTEIPDEDTDPCTVYVSMTHAAGCPEYNFQPILNILGTIMIFFGVTLQYFGRKV